MRCAAVDPSAAGGRFRQLPPVAVLALSYAAGSVPFSQIAARLTRGVDLRTVGSGTVSGTGLYEVAGFGPLAVAGVCEVAKGSVGPLLAGKRRPVLAAMAGAAAVAAHNWSPWLSGAGGRGISPAIGALLPHHPEGSALLLAGPAVGKLVRHTAVVSLIADLALAPLLGKRRGRAGTLAAWALLVPMLVKRMMGNHTPPQPGPRIYMRRLVFDSDAAPGPAPGAAAA